MPALAGRCALAKRAASVLRDAAPATFCKAGKYSCFRLCASNTALRGLTKVLEASVFSEGPLPWAASSQTHGDWAGRGAGRRRGTAIDRQLSVLVNTGRQQGKTTHFLTTVALRALRKVGLRPVVAQRPVACAAARIGTAVDVVALDEHDQLVLLEMKCGFATNRTTPAGGAGRRLHMRRPVSGAADTALNRHLCQLAATCAMMASESQTLHTLAACGVNVRTPADVRAVLMYVNDDIADLIELPDWWRQRGHKLLHAPRPQTA